MTATFLQNYTDFPEHFYTLIEPEALQTPTLIHFNQSLADELGIELDSNNILEMTAGQSFPEGLVPLAQKYTGHQFGYYNPDLGDGRGVLLGQVQHNDEIRDLHLKGSGQTPYSRRGDGRAVLRSAVREYLIGEALHGLGVPTTRCLSLCKSPEWVQRELLEPRASYIRVAKTHIRFGHFEWLAQQNDIDGLKQLADYVIQHVYPDFTKIENSEQRYSALLNTIVMNTAKLIAAWQVVGFCHGVMNTDNMSVAGETFDFGPYAFLDDCQIHYICNHSDTEGRYAYSQQPNIGLWNCRVLANSFSPLINADAIDEATNQYIDTFNKSYLQKMGYKFGLLKPVDEDKDLIADTLILLDQSALDFHIFFQKLALLERSPEEFMAFTGDSKAWKLWIEKYLDRIQEDNIEERNKLFAKHHPSLIFRNYIAQELIEEAENSKFDSLGKWMTALTQPFLAPSDYLAKFDFKAEYFEAPKNKDKAIALSCSS